MMESKVINVREGDSNLLTVFDLWWDGHGQERVPVGFLPKCGVMAEQNGRPVAVTWLYMDNSIGAAWVAWLTTRPGLKGKESVRALNYLLESVEEVADEFDYKLLFTMAQGRGLQSWFKRRGFIENHSGMSQLFKSLK
ncbi:MAG: hypothetical protein Unbinned1322contig1001_4 [Prokaryotic dsDNA virus sp.]|nr:hypothetical protein [Phycisphaerae bacterium]QDP50728.1 MAG: hypothetical protein Unbinned1322contig1001_4 [Prokaryotic dsDNA virus sp.]|tara:strand:- start:9389 stop:9802 length:414 start_codon:yes stop_codon:yes gene_type:complete